jgi:hypothetical protein
MRRFLPVSLLLVLAPFATPAQEALTAKQRIADLEQLASFYAKNYAPYEWKRDVVGFDLLRLTPWLQRVQHADDLEFQEALIEYVASLNDAHDVIAFPTTFFASLGFTVDIYDGKVLIDSINRILLPVAQFPFNIGDELVSVDGASAQQLVVSFRKYAIAANQRSTDRVAASRIVSRSQQIMPHTPDLGTHATIVVRYSSDGSLNTFAVPWVKTGIPISSQGPVTSPLRGNGRLFPLPSEPSAGPASASSSASNPLVFQAAEVIPADDTLPAYMAPIHPLLNASVSKDYFAVLGIGGRFPVWARPAGFTQRLGAAPTDFFFTGHYTAGGLRIGVIRIPSMAPPSVAAALAQLDSELTFFNANTDALVIDVMRNPGGLVSFVDAISQRFIPAEFQTLGFQIRATGAWLFSFAAQLNAAKANPTTPPNVIANLQANFDEVLSAYNEGRPLSDPVSLHPLGSLTLQPLQNAYTKPLIVLVDEFSASGGDAFPAIMQDNNRGPIVGMRTMGAGGSVIQLPATAYTESISRFTVSMMHRGRFIQTPDFPPAPYVENIGVRPDIVIDYMTRANLMTAGAPFVQAFTQVIVDHATP